MTCATRNPNPLIIAGIRSDSFRQLIAHNPQIATTLKDAGVTELNADSSMVRLNTVDNMGVPLNDTTHSALEAIRQKLDDLNGHDKGARLFEEPDTGSRCSLGPRVRDIVSYSLR